MIANIFIWLYMLGLSYVYGSLLVKLLQASLDNKEELRSMPLILMTGLLVLTTLASFFSIFFKIGLVINLLLMAGALTAIFTRRVAWPQLHRPALTGIILLLILAVVIVLENSTHRPINPDTNIYHAQAIHWIESFPAVAGLGNLHGRLAFNSAWFVTNALLSFSFLGLRSFHLAGSFFFLLFVVYCWPGFESTLRGKISLASLLKTAFIPIAFSLLGAELSSPGTDLPASLLIWLVVILWLENAELPNPLYPVLIGLFSVFAITIKLSALPIILLALFVAGGALYQRQIRMLTLLAGGCLLVVLPFLIRNVILSGYLIYPFPSIDLFSFDWKIPLNRAMEERTSILAWGRFPLIDPAKVLAMPFSDWFPLWFVKQTLNRRMLLSLAGFSVFGVIPLLRFTAQRNPVLPVWLASYCGVWFWLLSAPDFRFGYGFIIPAILLAFLPWVVAIAQYTQAAARRTVLFSPASPLSLTLQFVMLVFLGFTFLRSTEIRTLAARVILPIDYDNVLTQPCDLANGRVFCAKINIFCAYNDFPCIPSPRPWVQLRGGSFADGFRAAP